MIKKFTLLAAMLLSLGCQLEEDSEYKPAIGIDNQTDWDLNIHFSTEYAGCCTKRNIWFSPANSFATIPHDLFEGDDPAYIYGETSWFGLHTGGAENPCGEGLQCYIGRGSMITREGTTRQIEIVKGDEELQ